MLAEYPGEASARQPSTGMKDDGADTPSCNRSGCRKAQFELPLKSRHTRRGAEPFASAAGRSAVLPCRPGQQIREPEREAAAERRSLQSMQE